MTAQTASAKQAERIRRDLARERASQLRGLLYLVGTILSIVLVRACVHH